MPVPPAATVRRQAALARRAVATAACRVRSKVVSASAAPQRPLTVVFDAPAAFHFRHIEPVVELLSTDPEVSVTVLEPDGVTLPRRSAFSVLPRAGLTRRALQPVDAYVGTDFGIPWWLQDVPAAFFLHGVGPKVTYFTDPRLRDYDIVLAPSPYVREKQIEVTGLPETVLPVGLPVLDDLLRRAQAGTHVPTVVFEHQRPVVLYAPSWSRSEELISEVADIITRLAQQQTCNVLVRPHPNLLARSSSSESIKDALHAAERMDHVHIHQGDNTSIYDVLAYADLLVSDFSSVLYEYLVLDRPIALAPSARAFEQYAAGDVRLQTIEACTPLSPSIELGSQLSAILRTADDPTLRTARHALRNRMIYEPGDATTTMARAVKQMAMGARCA